MGKIFITGSADGLGQMAATALVADGHDVVLHARNQQRADQAMSQVPGAKTALVADLADIAQTRRLAEAVNAMGSFDVVIHNAGVYNSTPKEIFAVNTIAPYVLTALITKPKRLVYLSSGMHLQGVPRLADFKQGGRNITYSDSKLHVLTLCKAVARKWADVYSNAVDPGWVPTKMGGKGAPDDLQEGLRTQVWLASTNETDGLVTGRYFFHKKQSGSNAHANDVALQDEFLLLCEELTGVPFP